MTKITFKKIIYWLLGETAGRTLFRAIAFQAVQLVRVIVDSNSEFGYSFVPVD